MRRLWKFLAFLKVELCDFWEGFLEELKKEIDKEIYKFLKRHRKVKYILTEEEIKDIRLNAPPIKFKKRERLTTESIRQMDKENYDILMQTIDDECSVSIIAWIWHNFRKFRNKILGLHPLVGHTLRNGTPYRWVKYYTTMFVFFTILCIILNCLGKLEAEHLKLIEETLAGGEEAWWTDEFIPAHQVPKTESESWIYFLFWVCMGIDWFYSFSWRWFILPLRFFRFKGYKYFKSTKIPNFVYFMLKIVCLYYVGKIVFMWTLLT